MARLASGGRYGLAQSLFQVGGNFGQSLGPLLAAFIVVPLGQGSVAWFSLAALLGIDRAVAGRRLVRRASCASAGEARRRHRTALPLPRRTSSSRSSVLALLTFSKNIYMASISSYYTFYVIDKLRRRRADVAAHAVRCSSARRRSAPSLGGPIGDRFGAKFVIWFSILGVLPFTLVLPYADLVWTVVLSVVIGLILASAFSAIVVFAQELLPGRVGMVAGIFFGFAFGMGGIAAAALGVVADAQGIEYVFWICSFLPLLGLLTVFLPSTRQLRAGR